MYQELLGVALMAPGVVAFGHSVPGLGLRECSLVLVTLPGLWIQYLENKDYTSETRLTFKTFLFLATLGWEIIMDLRLNLRFSRDSLLFEAGAFNFSLKVASILEGKVYPRSQMSTSFLIFS